MHALVLAIELYLVIVCVDVLLAWVQTDPRRWPRRATHALTEPPQALVRRGLARLPTAGWDLSPVAVVLLLGAVRLWVIRM